MPVALYGVDSVYSAEVADLVEGCGDTIACGILTGPPEWDLSDIPNVISRDAVDDCVRSLPTIVPWVTPRYKRQRWDMAIGQGFRNFYRLVHPSAYVSPRAKIGEGVIINLQSSVAAFAELGDCVLVGAHAHIAHHGRIGSFTSICQHATIGGRVSIGLESMVAISAAVSSGKTVGDRCVIAMGSAVIRDVPDDVMVAGSPAAIKRRHV